MYLNGRIKNCIHIQFFYNNEIHYFNEETGAVVVMREKELHSYKTNAVL
jgi:hypothetical protein